MKHISWSIAGLIFVGVVVGYILPMFLFPSGVWFRRVIREHPLNAPIAIDTVRGDKLVAAKREFRLAGVALPTAAAASSRAAIFLRLATAQGVEVIRDVEPPSVCILRCEPRIWHWCGNDPVAAHYEQFNLNELILALGYATFDPTATGLNEDERLRLRAAELVAQERKSGVWNQTPQEIDSDSRPDSGISISRVSGIPAEIEFRAESLKDSDLR